MKILALDSSAVSASAAVLDDDKVLGEFFINTKQTHSQTLMPMVQQVLTQTKTSLEEMDLFAVSAGPGSFTGVRIGVACVKGMAFAQNKPCIGVSTLEAMAYPLSMLNGIICAVMDARCQQVYHALFRVNGIEVERICDDCAVANGEAEKGILCCGTGIGISIAANKVKGIRAAVVTNAFCAKATREHNDANILCMGGRVITEKDAVEFTKIFLTTEFEGGRHQRRIDQIAAIEQENQ